MKRREFYLDAVKAVLILLVVCSHAVEIGSRGSEWGCALHFFINLFVIPVFLFVQGYLSKSTAESDQKILGRCLFYFALFCVGKLFYYGGFYLIDGNFPPWAGETFWHEDSVPWYMLSSIFFTGTLWLARQVRGKTLLVFSIAVSVATGCFPQIGSWLSLSRTLVFMPFFFTGYYFSEAQLKKFLAWKNRVGWKLAGGAALGLVVALLSVRLLLARIPTSYDVGISLLWGNAGYATIGLSAPKGCVCRVACYLISFVSGSAFLLTIPTKRRSTAAEWIVSRVGPNTIPVYLLHYPVLLLCWRKVFPPEIPILWLIVICMILVLILSAPILFRPVAWLRAKTLELAAPPAMCLQDQDGEMLREKDEEDNK